MLTQNNFHTNNDHYKGLSEGWSFSLRKYGVGEDMENFIIIGILVVLLGIGISSAIKHFQGKSGCCGGGNTYISKKKLDHVIGKKTVMVEGMTCENCKARVTRAVNDMDGLSAKVNLRKKEVLILMEKEVSDETIKAAIEKAGYEVLKIS